MRIVMLFCLSVLSLASSIPASAELINENGISITSLLTKARTASKAELWASDSVARDKLWVYVDSLSTDKVEQGLDLLPGYQWISIKPADGTVYKVLGPDYIERSKWSSLADAADEAEKKMIRQYAEKRLAEYRAALALSKDGLQSLETKDPNLVYDLTTPSYRVGVEILASLSNEQMNQVFSPGGLRVNVRNLPQDMQRKLLDSTIREMINKSAGRHAQQDGSNALSAKELEGVFINSGALQFSGYDVNGFFVTISSDDYWFGGKSILARSAYPEYYGCRMRIVKPKYSDLFESRALLLQAKGMSIKASWNSVNDEEDDFCTLRSDVVEKERKTRLAETPPRFGLRTAPDVKIDQQLLSKFAEGGYPFYIRTINFIPTICEQKGYSFFSLSPHLMSGAVKVTDNIIQLGYALDLAADVTGDIKDFHGDYVWAYQNEQIILSSKHFASNIDGNIPLSTINRLRAVAAKTNGVFDLDGLVEVVSLLNQRQLDALPLNLPDDLEDTGIEYAKTQNKFIQLYASLSTRRREKACNGGVSFTVLGSKQRDLFYEALGSAVTAIDLLPEPSYFSVDDWGSQNGRYHLLTFVFGFVDGTGWSFDLMLPVPKVNSKTAQSAPKADDKVEPTQPQVLAVMNSLSEWNYSGMREHDDDNELKAIMYSQIGDKLVKRILKVGETLEGAKLVEIGEKSAIFTLDGAQITFPITQAVALAPFEPTPSTSFISLYDRLDDILMRK
ncbi:MAG: hypothetical protein ABFD64_06380 [Armatimonadota bacterium]